MASIAVLAGATSILQEEENNSGVCDTKDFVRKAFLEFCKEQEKIPNMTDLGDQKDSSYFNQLFLWDVKFWEYLLVVVMLLLVWRSLYDVWLQWHGDNVAVLRSVFHVLVPAKDFHVIGDMMVPYFLLFVYLLSCIAIVDSCFHDIIDWNSYVPQITGFVALGLSLTISQGIKSWWEQIQLTTGYNFHEGDIIEIGDKIKGLVKEINVTSVTLEVEDEKYEGIVLKFVPPTIIREEIITIVKRKRRRNATPEDTSSENYYEELLGTFKGHILVRVLIDFVTLKFWKWFSYVRARGYENLNRIKSNQEIAESVSLPRRRSINTSMQQTPNSANETSLESEPTENLQQLRRGRSLLPEEQAGDGAPLLSVSPFIRVPSKTPDRKLSTRQRRRSKGRIDI